MAVLETKRLSLHRFTLDDAPFVLELLGDPDFLRFIGDKGVRTVDDARDYLTEGPLRSYARFGFGLLRVARRDDGVPLGMCGLLRRDALADVDIGFAFLPAHRGQGYALEAASAVLDHGRAVLRIPRIVAIASPDNARSARLLAKLGLEFDRLVTLSEDEAPAALFTRSDPEAPA